jgi:signal peptidase I
MGVIQRIFSSIFDFLQGIVVVLALMVMMYLYIMSPQEINGASMEPTFHNKEFILTNKIEYKFREPKRGDVVIFKSPRNKDIDYIKRIIGVPGDRVELKAGSYHVNGQQLFEPYLAPNTYTAGGNYLRDEGGIIVPGGRYFVSGDNRGHSSDSREFGPVPMGDFIGKAFLRYWPLSQAGVIQPPAYTIR